MKSGSMSVIVCAYTWDRLELTLACLDGVAAQTHAAAEVIVVVDHNPELKAELTRVRPDVTVIANGGRRGLSSARNAGIAASTGPIVAFLDDDAVPESGWLAALEAPFDDSRVAVTGGHAEPDWAGGRAPGWLPPEFLWVVGCSFRGQVTDGDARNPIGCSMAFRRSALELAGPFDPDVGRLGAIPLGCEETEICLRLRRADPTARIVMTSDSVVRHHVPAARQTLRYFLRRGFYEGVSKAVIRSLAGSGATSTELIYATRTLPSGMLRALGRVVAGRDRRGALGQLVAIPLVLAVTIIGFGYGTIVVRRASRVSPINKGM